MLLMHNQSSDVESRGWKLLAGFRNWVGWEITENRGRH